jgi:sugar lactone lactonase YvrE
VADQAKGTITQVMPPAPALPDGGPPNPPPKPVVLVKDQPGPCSVALDANRLYWVNLEGGTVMSADRQGGSVTTLARGLSRPQHLVADATHLYVSETGPGRILAIAKQGGALRVLGRASHPVGMALDPRGLYVADLLGGRVLRFLR